MYLDLTFLTVNALAFGTCGVALWKGETPERWASGAILLSMVPTIVLILLRMPDFPTLELVGDGLTAVGLLILTMIYGRLWLGAAMLFQAAQFSLHSYYLVTERKSDLFHAIVNNVNFLGIMLSLATGTALAVYRRARARRALAAASAT